MTETVGNLEIFRVLMGIYVSLLSHQIRDKLQELPDLVGERFDGLSGFVRRALALGAGILFGVILQLCQIYQNLGH